MRIGITQRVDLIADYEETRDSLDQRWSELIEFLGAKALPIPNKIKDINLWLDEMRCDGFILSGGNDLSGSWQKAFHLKEIKQSLLCCSMQMINLFLYWVFAGDFK